MTDQELDSCDVLGCIVLVLARLVYTYDGLFWGSVLHSSHVS